MKKTFLSELGFLVIFIVFLGAITFLNKASMEANGQSSIKSDLLLMKNLKSQNLAIAKNAFQTIMNSINEYNPILLCEAGKYQFKQGKEFEGFKLYSIGRLRIIYDIGRCADKTVAGALRIIDQQSYPTFFKWVSANRPLYLKANLEAIEFFESNEEKYDQRWINPHGMRVMNKALKMTKKNQTMSIPKTEWKKLKNAIIVGQRDNFQNYEENYFIGRFGRKSSFYFKDKIVLKLARAAANGDKEKIFASILEGADVNFLGENGVTPLAWAIGAKNSAGVEILLKKGANPNIVFEKGISGIGLAIFLNEIKILNLLLDNGGKIKQKGGKQPHEFMRNAVYRDNKENTKIIKILHKHGVSIDREPKHKISYLYSAISSGSLKNANLLIELGAGKFINEKDKKLIRGRWEFVTKKFKDKLEFIELKNSLEKFGVDLNIAKKFKDKPEFIELKNSLEKFGVNLKLGKKTSKWQTFSKFKETVAERKDSRFFPIMVEGKCSQQTISYRALFAPLPPKLDKYSFFWGIRTEKYLNEKEKYISNGYSEVSHQTFKDVAGTKLHQVVFLKMKKKLETVGSRSLNNINLLTGLGAGKSNDKQEPIKLKDSLKKLGVDLNLGQKTSKWQRLSKFQKTVTEKKDSRFFPIMVEGKCTQQTISYRALFAPFPPNLNRYRAFWGNRTEKYLNRKREYISKGYSEVFHQTFLDAGETELHQAVFLKMKQ